MRRPAVAELADIYQNLVSADQMDRILALKQAADWYKRATDSSLLRIPVRFDKIKSYERAKNACNLGVDVAATVHESELALKTALSIYGSIWPHLPSVQVYYEKLEQQRVVLEAQAAARLAESATVLSHLNEAFKHLGIVFVGRVQTEERLYEGKTVILSYERLRELKRVLEGHGLDLMLNEETRTAFVLYGKGYRKETPVDSLRVVKELKELYDHVIRYKKSQEASEVSRGSENLTRGKPGAFTSGYIPGHALAAIWEWLADGKWHEITGDSDLEDKYVDLSRLGPLLKAVERKGLRTGKWKFEWSVRAPGRVRRVRMVPL